MIEDQSQPSLHQYFISLENYKDYSEENFKFQDDLENKQNLFNLQDYFEDKQNSFNHSLEKEIEYYEHFYGNSFISNDNDEKEEVSFILDSLNNIGSVSFDLISQQNNTNNLNFIDEDISQISLNRSLLNSDNHDVKLMNQILPNSTPLKENIEYGDIMNKNSSNLNKTQIKHFDSQICYSAFKNNNEISLSNKSKNNFSLFYSNLINNKDQSNSSVFSLTLLSPNMVQGLSQTSYWIKNNEKNDSFVSTYSNKKRKRNKIKVNNSYLNIKNNFKNESEFLTKQNNNKDKTKLFEVKKINNFGRKKKDSGEEGKHTKNSKDNLRSKVKTCSLNFLYEFFNKEIHKINLNDVNKSAEWRLYKIKTLDNKTKIYNLDLLNQSLKSIFSGPISHRADKNENHNKDLIDKIYKINQEGNSEKTKKIIKLFNMKYKDFFDYVKKIKDNKNLHTKIDGVDDDIKDMIKQFDFYLEENLSKDSKDKCYNQDLIELIKNFPSDISNMIVKKKKK